MTSEEIMNLQQRVAQASMDIIGKTPDAAAVICTGFGLRCRWVSVDGQARIVTRDIAPERIGLFITNGVVTETQNG